MQPRQDDPIDSQRRLGGGMIILMWLLVVAMLTWAFSGWLSHARNPNQHVQSMVARDGSQEVVLERNRYGHYVTSGAINGQPVTFILDTGASDVSIPARLAQRLGLARGPALTYQTAAGPVVNYLTRLDSVAIGPIRLHDVRASINPNVDDDEILLGMSFLKHIELIQRGDTLTLRR